MITSSSGYAIGIANNDRVNAAAQVAVNDGAFLWAFSVSKKIIAHVTFLM
jgi:hypothetical protein